MHYTDVLEFWFEALKPEDWWKKSPELDKQIRDRFGSLHGAATAGELLPWRETGKGRLAEIIVLDQFSRNIYRGEKEAFAYDGMALVLAQEAVMRKVDCSLKAIEKAFVYMPYMHSESPQIHEWAVELFSQEGLEHNLKYELQHKEIIDRFGRYPHRNAVLGRESTPEEVNFLKQPGSSF